jgi:tetratricopeptide (TPR) repeat protein
VTNDNAPALAQVCHHLDGIPLAIELAAAKVRVLNPEQINARLDDRFSLLKGGSRTALPRHQTLQAAIDWSYELLSTPEQNFFQRLSVFVDGWTLEAAESVCSDANIKSEDILDLLTLLINKSLVNTEALQSETRYGMLETIRQYANGKFVGSDENNLLRDHHLAYYLNLAETAAPHLTRPEQVEWLARLDSDYENLRAALEWGLTKESPESSLCLCAALGRFWLIRCYWKEGSTWLERALEKPSAELSAIENTARARALYQDAAIANVLDNLERMQASAESSLALCEAGTDLRDLAIAKFYVGFTLYRLEVNEKAQPLFEQSLVEFRKLKDLYWEAYTQRWLLHMLAVMGQRSLDETIRTDIELAWRAGERVHLASALFRQAQWEWENNQIDEAEVHLKESETLCNEVGTINSLAPFYQALIAHYSHNDYHHARAMYTKSKEQCELDGGKYSKSLVLENLGILARDEGDLQEARSHIEEAIDIAREVGSRGNVGFLVALLGQIEFLQGNAEQAKYNFKESLLIAKENNNNETLYVFSNSFANMNPRIAVQVLRAVRTYLQKSNEPLNPFFIRETQHIITQARHRLDESAFNAAWSEGKKMSLNDIFDLALKTVDEM